MGAGSVLFVWHAFSAQCQTGQRCGYRLHKLLLDPVRESDRRRISLGSGSSRVFDEQRHRRGKCVQRVTARDRADLPGREETGERNPAE